MSRVWEIIESTHMDRKHHGEEDKIMKAYECGYEEGYEDASKEMEQHRMGERSYRANDPYTGKELSTWSEPSMGQREATEYRSSMHRRMSERRSRDSRGRYM